MSTPTSERHRPWALTGIILVMTSSALAITALIATGAAQVVSAILLSILVPTAAFAAACIVRSRYERRLEHLETELQEERSSNAVRNRVYVEFTHKLAGSLDLAAGIHSGDATVDADDLVRRVENLAVAAQIDAGTYRPRFSVVHLDREIVRIVEANASTSIDIATDVRSATVWCDPAAVGQIVMNVLHSASQAGATTARIDVEERNGLGILSITDDRRDGDTPDEPAGSLLESDGSLAQRIVPELVDHQGATATITRTLGWVNTVIRFPVATPAQRAASSNSLTSALDASRSS